MWTAEHRRLASRQGLRYPSDLTDGGWELIEPMIPPAKRGGRRREVNVRRLCPRICGRRARHTTTYFGLWDWDGPLERVRHALYVQTREQAGREASPSAAIIDTRSGKGPKKGLYARPGKLWMRARKSPAASSHSGRYAGPPAERGRPSGQRAGPRWCGRSLRVVRRSFPIAERIFADAGYQGQTSPRWSPRPAPGACRSSSAPLPGSAATDAGPATSSVTPEPSQRSFASP
jgi:transposase